jgi:hypothetical protein
MNMKKILAILIVIISIFTVVDVIRFPECYISTWKYQLQNDIEAGDQEAIEYYNETYVKNNRILFD